MIKAVTFDLDGVYFTPESYPRFKRALPKTVTDPLIIDLVLSKSSELMRFKRGDLSESEYWDYVRHSLGVSLDNNQIGELLAESYEVDSLVVDTIKRIRSLGIKTCICTNNFPTRIKALDSKFHFLSGFNVKIISYETRSVKPEPAIFQTLIKKAGCLPSELIFADDNITNVTAAKNLGVNAFLYQSFNDFIKNLQNFGVNI
jgi:epoxide hydrolase-like predicted phosphatase